MASSFPVAAPPSPEKLRGGYYTPPPIARFISQWVGKAGPQILEPSCGDGAVLSALPPKSTPTGIEIEPSEAAKARRAAPNAKVIAADFFDWFDDGQPSVYSIW
jgi:adenine-specific DNA methylase